MKGLIKDASLGSAEMLVFFVETLKYDIKTSILASYTGTWQVELESASKVRTSKRGGNVPETAR